MLTAYKEDSPLDNETLPRVPNARSLDRMVNSIEGLRERVQGFTLEQVSEVDQRLRKMSLQLGQLEQTVTALAEIKQKIGSLQVAVRKSEAEILERSKLVTTVEPMAVQSLARIGTLLKFQRVMRSLKEVKGASGVLVSLDGRPGAFPALKPVDVISTSRVLETDLAPFGYASAERASSLVTAGNVSEDSGGSFYSARTQVTGERVPSNPTETTTILEASTHGQQLATDSSAIEDALSDKSASDTPDDDESKDSKTTEAALRLSVFEPYEPISNESGDAPPDERTTSIESQESQEIVAEFADTRDEPPSVHVIYEADDAMVSDQTQMPVSEDPDFDQHLLDDLIKDYGEFTILPRSPKHEEPETEPGPAAPQFNAFEPPIAPTPTTLPMARRDGDLDRKLKNLIKDYGEYDLYSRQTPLKLKTGVILAFLVLTLIFSGFYFFSSTKLPVPGNSSSVVQPQALSETAPKERKADAEAKSSETPSTPSASTVDLPKPVETGTSQSPSNRGQTKKITK